MAFSTSAADGADREVAGGNVVALHELLGKSLAAFQHGRGAGGAKDAQAALLKSVHNAQRKRQLRPDDGQGRLLSLGQPHHGIHVLQVDGNAARDLSDAAVAGRANHLCHARTALQRPRPARVRGPRNQGSGLS